MFAPLQGFDIEHPSEVVALFAGVDSRPEGVAQSSASLLLRVSLLLPVSADFHAIAAWLNGVAVRMFSALRGGGDRGGRVAW